MRRLELRHHKSRTDLLREICGVASGQSSFTNVTARLQFLERQAVAQVSKPIHRAARKAVQALDGLRARIVASKSANAVRLARELGELAREAIAGSELLAEGLAAARQEITVVRAKMFEWRDAVVFWMYIAATTNTLVWLWGGLGQLCLIGWGRRRFAGSGSPPPLRKDD